MNVGPRPVSLARAIKRDMPTWHASCKAGVIACFKPAFSTSSTRSTYRRLAACFGGDMKQIGFLQEQITSITLLLKQLDDRVRALEERQRPEPYQNPSSTPSPYDAGRKRHPGILPAALRPPEER